MLYPSAFFPVSKSLLFHIVRNFSPFLILIGLVAHQLLFPFFTDPSLSILLYSSLFLIFFINSFFLFFYRDSQIEWSHYMMLPDALFLASLVFIMGPLGLFFVFTFAFIQSLSLFIFDKKGSAGFFLLFLSIFLPWAYLWQGKLSFSDRLSLTVLSLGFLSFIFLVSGGLHFLFQWLQKEKGSENITDDLLNIPAFNDMELSLGLARKLKPVLNSVLKYFPESRSNKNVKHSVSPEFFSPERGRDQLEKMRKFILDFIDYSEPEIESFQESLVDLKKLLENLLQKLKSHPQRPEHLTQDIKLPDSLKVEGSSQALEKGFECILVNAFEALKSQQNPRIQIQGFVEKSWVILRFTDNGHGIDKEDIKRLFIPLYSKRFGLKGLGLSYVQKVVKAHKANLSLKSSENGSQVEIRFPKVSGFSDNFLNLPQKKHKKAV